MPTVDLSEQEWQQVLAIIANAPWNVANPLLMKLGNQLREQSIATDSKDAPMESVSAKSSH